MNPAAKRIVAGNGGLFVDRFGLRAEQAAESKQLEQLIASATAVSTIADVESAGCVTISRKDSSPLQVVVSRLRGLDIDETHPIRAIVFICDTTTHTRPTRETLMAHFRVNTRRVPRGDTARRRPRPEHHRANAWGHP